MRQAQLEHAILAACQIIGHPAVIIVGSQAILGSYGVDLTLTWWRSLPAPGSGIQ